MTETAIPPSRWPQVPACYGWLSLNRRGQWRLQGEPVNHPGLIAFLNQNYQVGKAGERGACFVQNGPQKVYVELAAAPWIFQRKEKNFIAHTGAPAGKIHAIFLTAEGNLYLHCALGFGLLDDRDLASFLSECAPNEETHWLTLMAGEAQIIRWQGIQITRIEADELAQRFAFDPRPQG